MKKFNFIADSDDIKDCNILRAVINYYGKEREGKTWEVISLNHDTLMKKAYGTSHDSALRELGWQIRFVTGKDVYKNVYRITNVNELPGSERIKLLNEAWEDALLMKKQRVMAIEERKSKRRKKKELFKNLRGVKNVRDYIEARTMDEFVLKRIKHEDGYILFPKRTYRKRQDGTFNWDLIKKNIILRDIEKKHNEAFKIERKRTKELRFDELRKLGLGDFYSRCKMEKEKPYLDKNVEFDELVTLVEKLKERGYKSEDNVYVKIPVRKDGKDIKDVVESFREIGAYL